MSENLIIGSSHALQLAQAIGEFHASMDDAKSDVVEIASANGRKTSLIFTHDRPHFLELQRSPQGKLIAKFSPFIDKIRQFNREECKVVFYIGGNEHNIYFMYANPKPFDFVHPSFPTVEAGRQIIPLSVMRETLRSKLERALLVTRLIAGQVPQAQRFYVAPPPPIPSEEHIRGTPEVFDFGQQGIERASVRLKLYQLYLEIVAAFCAEAGLTYLAPPAEHRDEQNFLKEAFWAGCTHASPDYYRGLVSELGL